MEEDAFFCGIYGPPSLEHFAGATLTLTDNARDEQFDPDETEDEDEGEPKRGALREFDQLFLAAKARKVPDEATRKKLDLMLETSVAQQLAAHSRKAGGLKRKEPEPCARVCEQDQEAAPRPRAVARVAAKRNAGKNLPPQLEKGCILQIKPTSPLNAIYGVGDGAVATFCVGTAAWRKMSPHDTCIIAPRYVKSFKTPMVNTLKGAQPDPAMWQFYFRTSYARDPTPYCAESNRALCAGFAKLPSLYLPAENHAVMFVASFGMCAIPCVTRGVAQAFPLTYTVRGKREALDAVNNNNNNEQDDFVL